ncbi:MAG: hypothetical protein ACRD2X_17365 [Vicinamibacteraceae bacterium]
MRIAVAILAIGLFATSDVYAQERGDCRLLCAPELKVEPTVTFSNIFAAPRITHADGTETREPRATNFEMILSLGLPTRVPWLEFTVEAIVLPFDGDSTPELELETNLIWLPSDRTRGWLSSHFDIVDKFSVAERPTDRRAYTHKVNFELDTSLAIFNWLPESRWLHGVELEGSLDYVATGLPSAGDRVDSVRFVDDASPWSFSIVCVLPVAPL